MANMVHSATDLSQHHVGHEHLAKIEGVAIGNIEPVDEERREDVEATVEHIVHFVAEHAAILKRDFFFVELVNLFEELGDPTVELDTLDVLEGLVDVLHALLRFLAFLLVDETLSLLAQVASLELCESLENNDESVPSNVCENKVGGNNEFERSLDVRGHLEDDGPDATSVAHDDGTDLALVKVLVSGVAHLQVLLEEHSFQCSVGQVASLNH